jgi:hypothetical protein
MLTATLTRHYLATLAFIILQINVVRILAKIAMVLGTSDVSAVRLGLFIMETFA